MLGTPPSCIKVHTAHQQRRITKLSYRTRRASSKSHRLPQMSLVLQLISNGCSLRAAREIKRLTDLGPWTGGLCSSDLEPPWLDLGPPLLIEGGVSGTSRGCRTCACRSSCCRTRTSNPRSSSSTPPNCTDVAGRSSCSRTPWGVLGDSDDMH